MRLRTQGGVETPFQFKYWVSDGGGSPRRSAPVLGRSNVGTPASPSGIGRIGTTGARCARGRAHSDNVVVRRHWPITFWRADWLASIGSNCAEPVRTQSTASLTSLLYCLLKMIALS